MRTIYSWRRTAFRPPRRREVGALISEIANLAELVLPDGALLSVVFAGPRTMGRLNSRHLGHDYVTDVICFEYFSSGDPVEPGDVAAEIFVSPDMALLRSESDYSLNYSEELVLYLVHGILHARGLGDGTAEERLAMRRSERKVMKALRKKFSLGRIFPEPPDSVADRITATCQ